MPMQISLPSHFQKNIFFLNIGSTPDAKLLQSTEVCTEVDAHTGVKTNNACNTCSTFLCYFA